MPIIPDDFEKKYYLSQISNHYIYDYHRGKMFTTPSITFRLVNRKGEYPETLSLLTTEITPADLTVISAIVRKDIVKQLEDEGFMPYPEMKITSPTENQVCSGNLALKVVMYADNRDAFTVEYTIDQQSWFPLTWKQGPKEYQGTFDTTTVENGSYNMTVKATDADGVEIRGSVGFELEN